MTGGKIAVLFFMSVSLVGCAKNRGDNNLATNSVVAYQYGCANAKSYQCAGQTAPENELTNTELTKTRVVNNRLTNSSGLDQALSDAIYANDYVAFAKVYQQAENKDSLLFTHGHFKGEPLGYLGLAMYLSDPRFFDLVVKYADPNIANFAGLTALFLAPDLCAVDKAKKLIAKGANVNYVSTVTGATPLHMVIGTQCYQLASLLLQHGADKQAKTKKGRTPYDLAVQSGNKKMAKLLK